MVKKYWEKGKKMEVDHVGELWNCNWCRVFVYVVERVWEYFL